MAAENPFVFDRPLEERRELLGRDAELTVLITAAREGRDVLVDGQQRHGKTSLVNVSLRAIADDDGALGVRVDCSGVLTASDVVRRLEHAYANAWANGGVEEALVERLEALSFEPAADPEARMAALLGVAAEVAGLVDGRAVLCLDDCEDALALPLVVDAINASRALEDRRVSYVFVGTDIAAREQTLWDQRAVIVTAASVQPIQFAGAITQRFAQTGRDAGDAARAVATVGAGHPQRTNLIAAQLWELTAEGERATISNARTAIEQALVRATPEFEVRWQALHGNERRVAVAVANELAPQGTRAQRATGLAGFGAAQRAVRGIQASGVARVRDDRLALTDPLFAEWLRRRHPQAPPEPDWQALRQRTATERGLERGE